MNIVNGMGLAILCVAVALLIGLIGGYLEYRLKFKPVLDEFKKHLEKTNSEIIKSKTLDENKND